MFSENREKQPSDVSVCLNINLSDFRNLTGLGFVQCSTPVLSQS